MNTGGYIHNQIHHMYKRIVSCAATPLDEVVIYHVNCYMFTEIIMVLVMMYLVY